MKSLNQLIAGCLIIVSALTACKKDSTEPPSSGNNSSTNNGSSNGQTANVIKGDIFDANGNKFHIRGASVLVNAWGPAGIGNPYLSYNMQMNANSHYELAVANAVYAMDAEASMPLNGNTVHISLQAMDSIPPNVQQASAPGIVKNFALRLTGLMVGGDPTDATSYFGAHIYVCDGDANFTSTGFWDNIAIRHPNSTLTFTITPQSPLIDGSTGQTQQISMSVEDLEAGKYMINIPFALQRVSAVLITSAGQQINLKLTPIPGITNPHTSYIDETFPPDQYGSPIIPQIAVWEN